MIPLPLSLAPAVQKAKQYSTDASFQERLSPFVHIGIKVHRHGGLFAPSFSTFNYDFLSGKGVLISSSATD